MKKIFIHILAVGLIAGMTSCDFDVQNYQDIPTSTAYETVQDVQNGLNGVYYAFGSYRFYGMNVVAIGDMASDVAQGDPSTGHYAYFSKYVIQETQAELEEVWDYGYKTIDRCVRTIQGAKKVLANAKSLHLTDKDIANVNLYMSQCYSLKALSTLTLANIFSLPYYKGESNLGLPLLDEEPLQPFVKIERSNVGKTYEKVLFDIGLAKSLMKEAMDTELIKAPVAFYMNESAIYALEARTYLFMGKDAEAKIAAEQAIELKNTGDKPSNEAYISMWSSLSISDEDIFTICKTESDNLSADALNTLYGSYKGALQNSVNKLFNAKDIRLDLISDSHPKKFDGLPTAASVSNIPVFRKSEMYLIIAEVEARAGNIEPAQNALFYTAKRDLSIESADKLPATKEELLSFIAKENVREFFEEGHRFYNARRTGERITVAGNKADFDIASFVYPIPAAEINAGFCTQQNEGWASKLPK